MFKTYGDVASADADDESMRSMVRRYVLSGHSEDGTVRLIGVREDIVRALYQEIHAKEYGING